MAEYQNRKFAVFSVSELAKIDFSEVGETSHETVRKSADGLKTFVKWDSEEFPVSVLSLTTIEGIYTYTEILSMLATEEWSDPNQPII